MTGKPTWVVPQVRRLWVRVLGGRWIPHQTGSLLHRRRLAGFDHSPGSLQEVLQTREGRDQSVPAVVKVIKGLDR